MQGIDYEAWGMRPVILGASAVVKIGFLRFPEMGADRPDWLPSGWKFIAKTRSCGRKDKYYVNPSGTKFNSKPEVLRHLEISKKVRKPREKVEIEKAHALPPGWIKKTVTTKKKGKIRTDPYYIDPDNGRQFRSVPEVLRYLGSTDSIKTKSKPDVKCPIYVGSISTRAVTRMSMDKKQGLENAVNSYSSSRGEISRSKQSEGDSAVDKLSDKMEKPANRKEKDQNLAYEKVNIRVDEPRVLRSGSRFAAREMIDTAVKNSLNQKKRKVSSAIGVEVPNEQPHVEVNEHGEGGRRRSKRLSEIKSKDFIANNESLQSGKERTAVEKRKVEESNEPEQSGKGDKTDKESKHDKKVSRPNRRMISGSKWSSDSPRRNPRRHSGRGVDSSLEIHTSNIGQKESKTLDEPDMKTYHGVKSSAEPKILPGPESTEGNQLLNKKKGPVKSPGRDLCSPKEHKVAAIVLDKKKEPFKSPGGGDLCLLEKHEGAVFTADRKEQSSKLISANNPESSLSSLLLDPCIEFAIKTLTGEIPIEDITKVNNGESPASSLTSPNQTSSSSMLPSSNILADPCFEFAIKTLTGDIPTENGSKFHISFEQPRSSLGSAIINGGLHSPSFTLQNYDSPSNHPFSPVAGVKTGHPRRQEDLLPNPLRSFNHGCR